MPALIIQKNDDGTVLIAAPAQIPPELMQGAQQVASVADAAKTVGEVLADDDQGAQGGDPAAAAAGGQSGMPDDSAQDGQPEPDADDASMQQGFKNVKGSRA